MPRRLLPLRGLAGNVVCTIYAAEEEVKVVSKNGGVVRENVSLELSVVVDKTKCSLAPKANKPFMLIPSGTFVVFVILFTSRPVVEPFQSKGNRYYLFKEAVQIFACPRHHM